MQVLVATDGSDAAIEAARRALTLLRPGAEILLVAVVPEFEDPEETAGGFEGPLLTEEQAEEQFEEGERAGVDALTRTAAALAATTEVRLVPAEEAAGPAIVAVADEVRPDLIVIGARTRGRVRRLLTGSISDHVVHHAPCPVLVIRSDHP